MNRVYNKKDTTIVIEPTKTLEEIADMMGITRERVRQIEQTALGKVRRELYKRGMRAEDFFTILRYTKPIKPSYTNDESEYELIEPERNEDD